MGLFTGIKTLITGSKQGMDIAEKATDGLIAGIDKMKFTAEERYDAFKEVAKHHLEVMKVTANESTTRSMTRRFLALILIGDYAGLMTIACLLYGLNPTWANYIVQTANNTNLGKLALWFGIFYSCYYGVNTIIDHVKQK